MYLPNRVNGFSAAMSAELIARYSPGGDIYDQVSGRYGPDAADRVMNAARSGETGAVAEELARARFGPTLNASTLSNFTSQMVNDPLAAPLEAANRQLGNLAKNLTFRNPMVMLVIGAVVYFAFFQKK